MNDFISSVDCPEQLVLFSSQPLLIITSAIAFFVMLNVHCVPLYSYQEDSFKKSSHWIPRHQEKVHYQEQPHNQARFGFRTIFMNEGTDKTNTARVLS